MFERERSGRASNPALVSAVCIVAVVASGLGVVLASWNGVSARPGAPSRVQDKTMAPASATRGNSPSFPSVTGEVRFPEPPVVTSRPVLAPPAVTTAPATTVPPPVAQQPATQPAQATSQPSSAPATQPVLSKATMPSDVRDWLKHLERVENRRRDLATTQLAGLVTEFVTMTTLGGSASSLQSLISDDDGPKDDGRSAAAEFAQEAASLRESWRDLVTDFRSLPPPRECVPIANSYGAALGETRRMATEVIDQLVRSAKDPQGAVATLMKMRNTSGDRIDVAAEEADKGVRLVCDHYQERKWFSVRSDIGHEFGSLASAWKP